MPSHVLLLGAVGTGVSFALASALRRSWGESVRLVGIDLNEPHLVTTSILCDEFRRVPPAASPEFLPALSEILKSSAIDTFVPVVNDEFRAARDLAKEFGSVDMVIPVDPGVDICLDKLLACQFFEQAQVPCPPTYKADQLPSDDVDEWFLKPRNSFGSRGAQRASREVLETLRADNVLEDYILQPFCSPPEVTVDCFSDADQSFLRVVCRERLETKSGVSTKARLFNDDELSGIAGKIAQALRIRGAFCFQTMQLDGRWVVTDLNLRPGSATAMSVAAGQDLLSAHFACRWNEPYEHFFRHEVLPRDVFVTRQYAEFVMHG